MYLRGVGVGSVHDCEWSTREKIILQKNSLFPERNLDQNNIVIVEYITHDFLKGVGMDKVSDCE